MGGRGGIVPTREGWDKVEGVGVSPYWRIRPGAYLLWTPFSGSMVDPRIIMHPNDLRVADTWRRDGTCHTACHTGTPPGSRLVS